MPSNTGMILAGGVLAALLLAWIANIIIERSIERGTREVVNSVMGLFTGFAAAFVVAGSEIVLGLLGYPSALVGLYGAVGLSEELEVTVGMYLVGVVLIMIFARIARERRRSRGGTS